MNIISITLNNVVLGRQVTGSSYALDCTVAHFCTYNRKERTNLKFVLYKMIVQKQEQLVPVSDKR